MVTVNEAREAFSGGIDKNDLLVLEDPQPMRRPVLPPDVAVQWRQLAEKACPHTLHKFFPTGVSFQEYTHQELSLLRSTLRVCGAKPLHSRVGLTRVVETRATALQLESRVPQVPGAVLPFGAHQANPQNNCATDFPTHPTIAVFSQTHSPTDASTLHAFLSHAPSSNDYTGTCECHAHHTEGRVEGWLVNSDHTACNREAGQALLQRQRLFTVLPTSLYLKLLHHQLEHLRAPDAL